MSGASESSSVERASWRTERSEYAMSGSSMRSPSARRSRARSDGRSRTLIITAAVLVVLFLGLTGFSSFWTERLWFKAAGFGNVFQTLLWTRDRSLPRLRRR